MIHGRASTYNNHKCRCEECKQAWNEYIVPRMKKWRIENPDKAAKHKYPQNPRKARQAALKRQGLTVEDYELILQQQNFVCAICERPPPSGRILAVDHCHSTGKIRGLLCNSCNFALGAMNDSPQLLDRAKLYLDGELNPKLPVRIWLN